MRSSNSAPNRPPMELGSDGPRNWHWMKLVDGSRATIGTHCCFCGEGNRTKWMEINENCPRADLVWCIFVFIFIVPIEAIKSLSTIKANHTISCEPEKSMNHVRTQALEADYECNLSVVSFFIMRIYWGFSSFFRLCVCVCALRISFSYRKA